MNSDEITARKDLVVWKFDFSLSTFFEIPTEQVEPLLPEPLEPMEVAPGVALINITAFHFMEGFLEGLAAFEELICSAIVAPDLRRGVPNFAMHVLSLASTSQAHLDHSREFYKLPIYGLTSSARIDPAAGSIQFGDADGTILEMHNLHTEPDYDTDERYFQAFVEDQGELYVADVIIKARLFEHQKAGAAGTLSNHPFFRGMDLTGAQPYLQMIGEPGKIGSQFYPAPELYR